MDLVHFSDAILGWQMIAKDFRGTTLWDIGSGNGFPGIVIGILEPKIHLVLLEADSRKAEYLKHCIDVLGLKNAKVVCQRLEDLNPNTIPAAVIRGFANISKTLLVSRKVMAPKAKIYHFKGPEWITELTNMPQQLCSTWNSEPLGDYSLPDGKIIHTIVKSDLV